MMSWPARISQAANEYGIEIMANSSTDRIDPRTAWQRWRPNAEAPWDLKRVGHLYRRAAFGASWTELQSALESGPDRTIDQMLHGRADADGDALYATMARAIRSANNGQQLPALWLYRMLYSTHPLREKLTLFWHNHFATSNLKVQNAAHMLGQYELMICTRHDADWAPNLISRLSRYTLEAPLMRTRLGAIRPPTAFSGSALTR